MVSQIQRLNHFLRNMILRGDIRSVTAKKNIIGSVLIKGCSIAISIVMVPITIEYVNPERYGIWLTLSSIVGWFSFFDIGMTQGLRNKFAIARANNDTGKAQTYVSTTYAVLALIFFVVWISFLVVNNFLDWSAILNTSQEAVEEISLLAIIVFTYFCLSFVLKIISTIIIADQQPAKASLIDLSGQVVSLILILVLTKTTDGSLTYLGIGLCLSPILVLIAANLYFFRGKYHSYRPIMSKVDFSYSKSLFNLGLVFFIIQIAAVVQFQSANIIITQNFGPLEVTSYNIVYKYFGTLSMGLGIFLAPFWSASTEAYAKDEIGWIKNAVKKYNGLYLMLVGVGVVMLIFSEEIYRLWMNGQVSIDFSLSFWGLVFFSAFMFGSIYVNLLNGISALRIQFIASIISPLVYVACALFFIKFLEWGVYSVFIAALVANFNGIILAPLQYYFIIYRNKRGIWVK